MEWEALPPELHALVAPRAPQSAATDTGSGDSGDAGSGDAGSGGGGGDAGSGDAGSGGGVGDAGSGSAAEAASGDGGGSTAEGALSPGGDSPAAAAAALWDGPAAGHVRWLYSDARRAYQTRVMGSLAGLLALPTRRVVIQDTAISSGRGEVTVHVWILDLDGDPSSSERPATAVQAYLGEWRALCERREADAPPAPPPPPPSAPPEPPPPDYRLPPPPYYGHHRPPSPPPPPRPGGGDMDGGGGRVAGGRAQVLVEVGGEPAGTEPHQWPCPVQVLGATIVDTADATPPSPPAAPPPPPPPSPPSPPPTPPYIECSFIPCEQISDEEIARLERELSQRSSATWDRSARTLQGMLTALVAAALLRPTRTHHAGRSRARTAEAMSRH